MPDDSIYKPRRPRRSNRLSLRGVDYHINEWGNAADPLLVYLHGWGDMGSTFQFVVDELSRDWFVVAPDWRGFGRSTGRAAGYWFPDYLADLDHLLASYSPDKPVRLVGHSMGGNVAGLYAGVMPERVSALINLEGFGLKDSKSGDAPANFRKWIERGHAEIRFGEREDFDALAKIIKIKSPRMSSAQAEFVAREWGEAGADGRIHLRADPAHKLPNPVLYRRAEAEACWSNITASVLPIAGGRSDFRDYFGESFAGYDTTLIEDSGHMLHFEQPAAVARLIEKFLEEPAT